MPAPAPYLAARNSSSAYGDAAALGAPLDVAERILNPHLIDMRRTAGQAGVRKGPSGQGPEVGLDLLRVHERTAVSQDVVGQRLVIAVPGRPESDRDRSWRG